MLTAVKQASVRTSAVSGSICVCTPSFVVTRSPTMPAVAALSTTLSTAALDRHPQSKERGITLDLGFSSFAMPLPEHLRHLPYDELQVTLVDCPGHASLIKTIIGGAQIINMMLLVVDVTRGIQTQVLCLTAPPSAAHKEYQIKDCQLATSISRHPDGAQRCCMLLQ